MIKFVMSYIDVIFPISLGRLTYKYPDEIAAAAKPGMLVSAPLRNKTTLGIIAGKNSSPPPGKIREVSEVHGESPVIGRGLLDLILWMSDYYIATEGIMLKQTIPHEIFVDTKARRTKKDRREKARPALIDIPMEVISDVIKSAGDNKYKAFLLHAPSAIYEYSMTVSILRRCRNVIVLLPEIAHANMLYDEISSIFRDRACILHSNISKGRRSEYVKDIISGKRDIIVGTRSALFAPLKNVSLIMVLHEHSGSYKLEEGIRYNMRDVAVMRGFLEKSAVLLSSITPSADSMYNTSLKKYTLIKPAPVRQPLTKIIDMRFSKLVKPNISRNVFEIVRSRLRSGKKVMFVINRRGHSTLLQCRECGHTEDCVDCNIPLVMHKDKNILKCHHCGMTRSIPDSCGRCRSLKLELLGAGTQKVEEDLKELFGMEVLRVDSDIMKTGPEIEKALQSISAESTKVIIGTKMMTRRIMPNEKFSAAVVLNIDASLNFPDFRASEKAYMELASIRELVGPEGTVFIQTRFPQNPLFKYFRTDDYASFIAGELSMRKELLFPPFARFLSIRATGETSLPDRIVGLINSMNQDIETLGPTITRNRKGVSEYAVLLKSVNRQVLNAAAKKVLQKYRDIKGTNIIVDVDPM